MNCKTAQAYINREIDGELTEDQQAALQQHLAECASCQAVRQQLVSVRTAMRELTALSNDAIPSLDESKSIPFNFGTQRTIPWREGLSVAAAIVVLLLGVWAWSGFLQPGEVTPETRQLANQTPIEQQPVVVESPKEQSDNLPVRRLQTRIVKFDPKSPVRVRCKPETDAIVVPIETKNPNVSIFWVYPTYKTAQRPVDRHEHTPSSSLRSPSWSTI